MRNPSPVLATVALLAAAHIARGQTTGTSVSAADYERAVHQLAPYVNRLVQLHAVRPNWVPDDRFWYRDSSSSGAQFILVDPTRAARTVLQCDPRTAGCIPGAPAMPDTAAAGGRGRGGRGGGGGRGNGRPPEVMSPDGTHAVFIRDWNLWMRDVATNQEQQLTTDGVKDFGYATDNAGWTSSDRPIVVWSPDSKKIATFQQDQRNVGEMYLVSTKVGHPELRAWKYPLPGDSIVTMISRVIIDVSGPSPKMVRLQMPPDQHRSTLCDHILCGGSWADVEWYPDGSHLAFVSTSRDHKQENLRVADAGTGAIRDVLEEKVATEFESGEGRVNWHVLPASNEVIWFSERDNWGQLYLYDLTTGALKSKITTGDGNVTQLLRVDEKNRVLYFMGVGKTMGHNPYYRHFYRIGMDGRGFALLTSENADHTVALSPSGKYFVDTYSQPDVAPVTTLRDAGGRLLLQLEKADISGLVATGWKPPQQIIVKARDGATDLYGLMFTPANLDSTKKYPIINHIYPGPQTGSVGGRSFTAARGDDQALADLGFIVVEIDGMGTPWRSKAFHDAYYGKMGDNTLPDQVAGMKELAQRYRWIDLDRAAIWGHSGGGFAAADAMFRFPDFFKVGISESGNHDNREYEDDWGERYEGLEQGDNYAEAANQTWAKNLKGKLLLAHGTMDNNVPPYNTLLVVDALIKANRDFDLILLPNQPHGYGPDANYMMRRRWDYFVRNLLGAEPPKEFEITTLGGGRAGGGPQ